MVHKIIAVHGLREEGLLERNLKLLANISDRRGFKPFD